MWIAAARHATVTAGANSVRDIADGCEMPEPAKKSFRRYHRSALQTATSSASTTNSGRRKIKNTSARTPTPTPGARAARSQKNRAGNVNDVTQKPSTRGTAIARRSENTFQKL